MQMRKNGKNKENGDHGGVLSGKLILK